MPGRRCDGVWGHPYAIAATQYTPCVEGKRESNRRRVDPNTPPSVDTRRWRDGAAQHRPEILTRRRAAGSRAAPSALFVSASRASSSASSSRRRPAPSFFSSVWTRKRCRGPSPRRVDGAVGANQSKGARRSTPAPDLLRLLSGYTSLAKHGAVRVQVVEERDGRVALRLRTTFARVIGFKCGILRRLEPRPRPAVRSRRRPKHAVEGRAFDDERHGWTF